MDDKDKRIKELEDAVMELFNLVHESDLIQNKIRANEIYQELIKNDSSLKYDNSKDDN